ncbi:hypothetical protein RSO01_88720 [Reyranella soli]|jgi:hypothetical protein|uniref:Uncharacterized protein n=1 Tax=Reyranella soli TaxID=1230389 RepID=A0A512NRX7_9HYPH|nr:hypothetical protein RSO01_88720 [Reyranella soli]
MRCSRHVRQQIKGVEDKLIGLALVHRCPQAGAIRRGGVSVRIGARTGVKGDQLDQVVADVVTAGLVERHVDKRPVRQTLLRVGKGISSTRGHH